MSPSSSPSNGYPVVEPYPPPSNPNPNSYPPNTYPPDPYRPTSIRSENQPSDSPQPPSSIPFTPDGQKHEPVAEEDDAETVLDWAEARELEIARLEAENARLRAELNINPAALKKAGIPDDPEAYLVATSSFGSLGGHNFHGHSSRSSSFSGGGHQNGVFVTASFPTQNQQQHPQHQQHQQQQHQQQYSQFNPHHQQQQQQPFPQHHPQPMHQYGGGGGGGGGTPPPQMGMSLQRAMELGGAGGMASGRGQRIMFGKDRNTGQGSSLPFYTGGQ